MMDTKSKNQTLLCIGVVALLSAALTIFCYYFVDRSVSSYVSAHQWRKYEFLQWMTYIPPFITGCALLPIIIVAWKSIMRRNPSSNKLNHLMQVSAALFVIIYIKNLLKIVFGRYWPETWVNNNLSWIQSQAYGFHYFKGNEMMESFPSGHTLIIFFVATVLWNLYPKLRSLYILCCILVPVGLIGMDYHFVGDTAGGAGFGIIFGIITNCIVAQRKISLLRNT